MIIIKTKTLAESWRLSFKELYLHGEESKEKNFYRYSPAIIEIEDINKDLYDNKFPMSKADIKIINDYLVTGKNENLVTHEWTKLYRKRLFSPKLNQIENIIEYLKKKSTGKRAQACVWNQAVDLYGNIGPCLQLIWVQVIKGHLEMHTHMRASDCYGKLLMNLNEFTALQRYITQRLNLKTGHYIQFIDSLHFNLDDKKNIDKIIKEI